MHGRILVRVTVHLFSVTSGESDEAEDRVHGRSHENVRLIEEEGYSLHVYTMVTDPDAEFEFELGVRKIGAILNDVAEAELVRDGENWYAVFAEEQSS